MSEKTKFIIFLAFALIIFNGTLSLAVADDDHKEKNGIKKSWTMMMTKTSIEKENVNAIEMMITIKII